MNLIERIKKAAGALAGKKPIVYSKGYDLVRAKSETGLKIGFDTLYDVYRGQADVKVCIREWRENVGLGGFEIINPKTHEVVTDKLKTDVLNILNYFQPFTRLKSLTIKDLGICDNAYWHLVKNVIGNEVIGILRIDPRTMSIISDEFGQVFGYVQKLNSHSEPIFFAPEEILHFKFDESVQNAMFGESPMESILWDALGDIEAAKSNYYFFLNDARPSMQFILKSGMDDEQIGNAVDMIRNQFKGSKNKGRSGVFSGIEDIKSFDISKRDMEFLTGRAFSREKTCEAYGVPQFILGITDKVNNNNGEQLREQFYLDTIEGKEITMESIINDGLNRIGLEGIAIFEFQKPLFNQGEVEKRALEEYKAGLITLGQYKQKTNQKIYPEDEALLDIRATNQKNYQLVEA